MNRGYNGRLWQRGRGRTEWKAFSLNSFGTGNGTFGETGCEQIRMEHTLVCEYWVGKVFQFKWTKCSPQTRPGPGHAHGGECGPKWCELNGVSMCDLVSL